jgi:predicted nucleic acid-binding protein
MTVKNETNAKLFIQQLLRLNSLDLCTSFVLIKEIQADKDDVKVKNILSFIAECTSGIYVSDKNMEKLKEHTAQIISTGVKEMDAVHVACAVLAECDYFITVDKRLLKYKSDRIKIVNPIEFVEIWEDKNA